MSRTDASGPAPATTSAEAPAAPASPRARTGWTIAGAVVVLGLAALVQLLTDTVPEAAAGTWFGDVAQSIA